MANWFLLPLSGLFAGLLAGLLGIGGGTVLVPILVGLGYGYNQAVATSSLAIVITSASGTWQNWRMGFLNLKNVILLGMPAIATAQLGAYLVGQLPDYVKEGAFGILLVVTIFLGMLRRHLGDRETHPAKQQGIKPLISRLGTGGAAGLLAGLFGVGGGVIMVPLQMLLLGETIKTAIQTSLGVIVITSISACFGHALQNNVLWLPGIFLGFGGLFGARASTRYLPKLPDRIVNLCFRTLLAILAIYFFWRSFASLNG